MEEPRKKIQDIVIRRQELSSSVPLVKKQPKPKTPSESYTVVKSESKKIIPEPIVIARKKTPDSSFHSPQKTSLSRNHFLMWFIIAAMGIVFVYVLSGFVAQATVTVVPQRIDVTINESITASTEPGEGDIKLFTMTVDHTIEQAVPAQGTEEVSERASGMIVVFNENSAPQQFVKETRFETTDGKIYMLGDSGITVPGASAGTPGSLEVTVYAEKPGESYNIGLTDFVIPGWREINNPKFDTQYARSKTPMTGGFDGERSIVDEDTFATAKKTIEVQLIDALADKASREIPEGFVMFDNGIMLDLDGVIATYTDEQATVSETGRMHVFLFSDSELSSYLASQIFEYDDTDSIALLNPQDITFNALQSEEISTQDITFVEFVLQGDARFQRSVSLPALSEVLAGVHRRDFQNVINNFGSIDQAQLTIRPLWRNRIPNNPKKTTILIQQ